MNPLPPDHAFAGTRRQDTAHGGGLPPGKPVLRAACRAYRAQLSEAAYARLSAGICAAAAALPEAQAARRVHCYYPLVGRREVDTRPLLAALHAAGKRLYLPVVSLSEDGAMTQAAWAPGEPLRPNRWGAPEPEPEACPLAVELLDLAIVPCLGAGLDGGRLGFGKGYYDRFLAGFAGPVVGLAYEGCLWPTLPCEAHDVRLTRLVTEARAAPIPARM